MKKRFVLIGFTILVLVLSVTPTFAWWQQQLQPVIPPGHVWSGGW
jgi:hypothetical protein